MSDLRSREVIDWKKMWEVYRGRLIGLCILCLIVLALGVFRRSLIDTQDHLKGLTEKVSETNSSLADLNNEVAMAKSDMESLVTADELAEEVSGLEDADANLQADIDKTDRCAAETKKELAQLGADVRADRRDNQDARDVLGRSIGVNSEANEDQDRRFKASDKVLEDVQRQLKEMLAAQKRVTPRPTPTTTPRPTATPTPPKAKKIPTPKATSTPTPKPDGKRFGFWRHSKKPKASTPTPTPKPTVTPAPPKAKKQPTPKATSTPEPKKAPDGKVWGMGSWLHSKPKPTPEEVVVATPTPIPLVLTAKPSNKKPVPSSN